MMRSLMWTKKKTNQQRRYSSVEASDDHKTNAASVCGVDSSLDVVLLTNETCDFWLCLHVKPEL